VSILIKKALLNNKKKDIYIEENRIREISDNITAKAEFNINAEEMAVIPGLVNAHTHAAMTNFRGYADDLKLDKWLNEKIWPLESKLTEKDVYWGSKLACLEMIKSGTTFFNDMYWHFHGTAKAVDESGIRSAVSAVMIDLFDQEKADEQIKLNKRLLQETKKYSGRVQFALGPHAIYTVSGESLQWFKDFSDKHDLTIHLHLSETKEEVDDCIKKNKLRPVEYLDKIGFLGKRLVACHSVWLNNKEIQLLKKNNVKAVHNPVSNMKLCSGEVFQYRKFQNAGITMALGTDGAASNNNLDMFEEMKVAALLQKHRTKDPTTMKAQNIFNMATIDGAKTFGLDAGQIKEGKLADLLLINLKDPSMVPNHNLISNIVYSGNGNTVDTTICDGKILMQNRSVDHEKEILENAEKTAKEIVSRA